MFRPFWINEIGIYIFIGSGVTSRIFCFNTIFSAGNELKTPLTTIQGYIQMLAEKALTHKDDFAAEALGKVAKQVKKMATLINGFLNISSYEAGKIYLHEEVFDMDALISEIIEEIKLITSTHTIIFSPCYLTYVKADRNKIGQVINNFLSNAIKYSPDGKYITILCKKKEGLVEVGVTDEGMGIRPEDMDKLFDRFHRIQNVQTKFISGFGLGLYLSSEIIKRHNGKIWVESNEGRGATFYFSLQEV